MAKRERERRKDRGAGAAPFPESAGSAKRGDPPMEKPLGERSRHGEAHASQEPPREPPDRT